MADNYYDMTGTITLDKVTPVIKALFGPFELDENYPGDGTVYIANIAENSNCSWDEVLDNLRFWRQASASHRRETLNGTWRTTSAYSQDILASRRIQRLTG